MNRTKTTRALLAAIVAGLAFGLTTSAPESAGADSATVAEGETIIIKPDGTIVIIRPQPTMEPAPSV